MSKAFANPKIFAAVCLIFAGATFFNVSANASSDMNGMSLRAVPQVSAPVQEVGPTIPPNPMGRRSAPWWRRFQQNVSSRLKLRRTRRGLLSGYKGGVGSRAHSKSRRFFEQEVFLALVCD